MISSQMYKLHCHELVRWFQEDINAWNIRVGWWISEVCAYQVIFKLLCLETAVRKDFSQKSIFAREITFENDQKKRNCDFLITVLEQIVNFGMNWILNTYLIVRIEQTEYRVITRSKKNYSSSIRIPQTKFE